MIDRIMLFKLHDSSQRDALAEQVVAALGDIREIEELTVGLPADEGSKKSWDLSVVIAVDNVALLNNVLEGAAFQAFLGGVMQGKIEVVKAWSFARVGS